MYFVIGEKIEDTQTHTFTSQLIKNIKNSWSIYLLTGESKAEVNSKFRIGIESDIAVNSELLAEPDIAMKGGDKVGLENRELNGDGYSVPGTVGSRVLLLLRIVSSSFSLQYQKSFNSFRLSYRIKQNIYISISAL